MLFIFVRKPELSKEIENKMQDILVLVKNGFVYVFFSKLTHTE